MFANFKFSHLIMSSCALALSIIMWILAENTSGDFHLTAQWIGALGQAAIVLKWVSGMFGPSVLPNVNVAAVKAAGVKIAAAMLGILFLGALIFAPKRHRTVLSSVVQSDGTVAYVESAIAPPVGQGCSGSGAVTPQTQADIVASEQLGMCIESTYAADSAKVPAEQALQIATDIAVTCGADALDLINTLGQTTASSARQAVAQAAKDNASLVHAAKLKHGAPAGQ